MAKSEYLQREEAAKKQLGAKGVKKRVKQLPTAARASLREMTGIDISRKGVSVDPIGLAMAVSPFKLLKATRALRGTASLLGRSATKGKLLNQAAMTEFALNAKRSGRAAAKKIAQSASTPKMGQQEAQDLYEATTDFVRSGRVSKEIAKSMQEGAYVVPKSTMSESGILTNARLVSANAGKKIKGSVRPIRAAKAKPKTKPAQTAGEKYRAKLAEKSTRVTELEKRLNLPGKAPKRGR